jgi:hypothetical protein
MREGDDLPLPRLIRKRGVDRFDAKINGTADVLEVAVPYQRAGQQVALGEDLEPVADTDDQAAPGRELLHGADDGRELGDGPAAQVVTVGEAAGEDNGVNIVGNRGIAVPQQFGLLPKIGRDAELRIVIAVGTGKNNYAKFHFPSG